MTVATGTTRYARYNRSRPTADSESSTWIACDESGQDGENLTASTEVLAHGSVRLDDSDAAHVIAQLEQLLPRRAPEFKFDRCDNARGAASLSSALQSGGLLHKRAHVYLVHKPYVATAKAIDLLIEESEHARDRDIYGTGEACAMARTLFTHGPRALGDARFSALLTNFVRLFRKQPSVANPAVTVDGFFALVDDARWRSTRRAVTDVLSRLSSTRAEATTFRRRLAEAHADDFPALDPLVPALAQTIRYWARQRTLPDLRVLHDRQNLLTDDRIDALLGELRAPLPEFRRFTEAAPVKELVRGDSKNHPSIQLADVIAGAGRAAASAALGLRTDAVATALIDVVSPLIDPDSLWGDEATWKRLTGQSAGR